MSWCNYGNHRMSFLQSGKQEVGRTSREKGVAQDMKGKVFGEGACENKSHENLLLKGEQHMILCMKGHWESE